MTTPAGIIRGSAAHSGGTWRGDIPTGMSYMWTQAAQKYVITPSMSRRGSCHGNAIAENFFSILKTECIYRHKPASLEEANDMFARFIYFSNHERIQLKTGAAATK